MPENVIVNESQEVKEIESTNILYVNNECINELPTFEMKCGNTIYTFSGEYSKTSTVTLKQRLEQIMFDRIAEMKWNQPPLNCQGEPSEDHDNT